MLAQPKLTSVNNSLSYLISLIDKKIYMLACLELDNIRYNLSNPINYELIEDLQDYRDIVEQKMLGCNCLEQTPINIIAEKIKKLINQC